MEELLRWAHEKGACVRSLRVSDSSSRAFVAAEDIAEGASVVSLPQSLLLHADVAYQDAEYGEAFRALRDELGTNCDQRHILCLLLLLERARGAASQWAPYINILPSSYDDPYWWSSKEVQFVAGTRLSKAIEQYRPGLDQLTGWVKRLEALRRSRSSRAADSTGVLSSFEEGWALTPKAACWARSTVWSRAFTVHQLCGGSSVVALVPVLDMTNHSPEAEVVWHTGPDGKEDFQFVTLTSVPKGALIKNNYGSSKTNDELLLAYGFVVPNNPADYFQVSLARAAAPQQPPPQPTSPPQPSASGGGGSAFSAYTGARNGFASTSGGAGSVGTRCAAAEEDEDPSSDLQQSAEDLQRDLAMVLMGLEQQQRLTAAHPLPSQLVHCAQVALLPSAELYQLSAQLLKAVQQEGQQPEPAAATDAQAGGQGQAHVVAQPHGGLSAPSSGRSEGTAGEGEAGAPSMAAEASYASAMHVVPRYSRGHTGGAKAAQQPAAVGPAAHLATSLLSGVTACQSKLVAHDSAAAWLALAPAAHQLPALVAVQQQVEAKLRGMVSEQQARRLLAAPAEAPPLLAGLATNCGSTRSPSTEGLAGTSTDVQGASAQDQLEPGREAVHLGPYGQLPPWLSQHGALALAYVRDQQRVLHASLQQLRERVGGTVKSLAHHARPGAGGGSGGGGFSAAPLRSTFAFDVHQPAASVAAAEQPQSHAQGSAGGTAESSQARDTGSAASSSLLCAAPAVFDANGVQHMDGYMQWLSAALASTPSQPSPSTASPRASANGSDSSAQPSTGSVSLSLGLCEVMCKPRREALNSAAAASRAAAAASASGSRGRRKPLASLTLRSLRNISSSSLAAARLGGVAAATAAATTQPAQPPHAQASTAGLSKGGEEDSHTQQAQQHSQVAQPPPQPVVPSLPAGIAASLGLDMLLAYDSMSWGAVTTAAHASGDVLLEVPGEFAVVGQSRADLLHALMIPAHDLLEELVAHAASAGQRQQQQQNGSDAAGAAAANGRMLQPREMLVLHLMHMVGAPPGSRLLASENAKVSMLIEMLEDSPAGTECTESFESLKSDFQQLSAGVAAASQAPTPAANRYKVMRKVLQWPGAFGLYCWAIGVLERCAVQVALPGGNGSLWCVLPVVSAVPQVLRDAALRVELAGGATGDAPSRLRVTAACALPPGLLLSPALLLPFDSVEHLLSTYGPEALAWRRLLARQHQVPTLASRPSDSTAASAAMSPVSNLSTGPASPGVSSASVTAVGAAAAATGAPDAEEEYLLSMKAAGPRVLYELYVAPGEEDELYELKMELLAAAGLGSVHFLTEGLETKPLVQSALKICLADEELLSKPLVQQVVRLSQALKLYKQDQPTPGQLEAMHPTSMAAVDGAGAGATARASGSSGAGTGAAVPHSFLQEVQQAQQQLVAMLEALPSDHPVVMAATKQLRQIVHDAQKHTKRRLRQMDTHEEQKTGAGGFWNVGASGQQQQQQQPLQQQQAGLELLRQGVHLYLEELVLVLGSWAQALGLESKLDPACRRSKVEPSCKRPKLRHGGSA